MNKKLNVIGIMNGTSLDGVDFVYTQINSSPLTCKFLDMKSFNFPQKLLVNLKICTAHQATTDILAKTHYELGRFYAQCFKQLPLAWKPELIGLHGQTVFHAPPFASLQIGEPAPLALISQVPVIFNFRALDLCAGGQGAPLATLFHEQVLAPLIQDTHHYVAIQNLGGIGNVTYIDHKKVKLSFDTGPANMLMDLFMQKYFNKKFDKDGHTARRGQVNLKILKKLLQHSYFKKNLPKSCGKEEFGEHFLNDFVKLWQKNKAPYILEDQMTTLCEFTAQSIALSYQKYFTKMPTQLILCGGGAHNIFLRERLQSLLPKCHIKTSAELGWPTSAVEGGAFALLAAYKLWNKKSNLPLTTGAQRHLSLGDICSL